MEIDPQSGEADAKSASSESQKPGAKHQKLAQTEMGRLLQDLNGDRHAQNLRLGEIIDRQRRIENARRKVFKGVQTNEFKYSEDQLQEKNAQNCFKAKEDPTKVAPSQKSSALAEIDKALSKYILIHCAKTELSLIDLDSGTTYLETPDASNPTEDDLMKIILRQNIMNQVYFEDLSFINTLRLINQTRYLFLEFVPQYSLLIVGNQGGHDLSIFRLKTKVDYESATTASSDLERIYVFKHSNQDMRILGVNIQSDDKRVRIYVFTSDIKLSCLEVWRGN